MSSCVWPLVLDSRVSARSCSKPFTVRSIVGNTYTDGTILNWINVSSKPLLGLTPSALWSYKSII